MLFAQHNAPYSWIDDGKNSAYVRRCIGPHLASEVFARMAGCSKHQGKYYEVSIDRLAAFGAGSPLRRNHRHSAE